MRIYQKRPNTLIQVDKLAPHLPRAEFSAALNRIGVHSLVAARPETIGAAGGGVFGFAAAHPPAPELER